jgi:Phage integrase, N-terminal SAM-like domain
VEYRGQAKRTGATGHTAPKGPELVIPNPKLKLMDQVREVLRVKHYAIRTEQAYCDWIRRYVRFHGMRSREELFPGAEKVEQFLSDLAVQGQVAASTPIKAQLSAPGIFQFAVARIMGK